MRAAEDVEDTEYPVKNERAAREVSAISQVRPIAPIEARGATHAGRVRARNEDAFAVLASLGLAMVADGLGGHPAGDVAARMAMEEIANYLGGRELEPTLRRDDDTAPRLTLGLLALAVQHANKAIHAAATQVAECNGMGTTLAAVLVVRGFAFLAHVGDSRVYRLREGTLVLLTEDHSMAAEYRRLRGANADPAILKRYECTLTRSLGSHPEVRVSLHLDHCRLGDRYLLCTDGLWGVVPEKLMARIVEDAGDLCSAADRLIEAANAAGGPDNITALVVRPVVGHAGEAAGHAGEAAPSWVSG